MKPTVFTKKDIAKQLRYANLRKVSRQCGVGHITLARLRDGGEVKATALEKVSAFYLGEQEEDEA